VSCRHHIGVGVDTEISRGLDWTHEVRPNLDAVDWNVMRAPGRCTPDVGYSVLDAFSCSLLLHIYCHTSSIQSNILACSEVTSLGGHQPHTCVSSVNKCECRPWFWIVDAGSAVCIKNNSGPRTEPCGTPNTVL